jgi:hypothetical protein
VATSSRAVFAVQGRPPPFSSGNVKHVSPVYSLLDEVSSQKMFVPSHHALSVLEAYVDSYGPVVHDSTSL